MGGLRCQHQVDPMGICGHALRLVAEVCPAAVTAAVLQLAASREQMSECVVDALALGKRSAEPSVQQVRMLLPQGVFLTVVDVLLSQDLHRLCDSLPQVRGLLEGCVPAPGRSASDVAHLGRFFIEKSLDMASRGCLLQSDIRAFYDGIDVVKAASCAAAEGLPHSVAAVAIRHQLAPQIRIKIVGLHGGLLAQRTSGAMTGSRTAGALGRYVIRTLGQHLWRERHTAASVDHGVPMLMATYADNL